MHLPVTVCTQSCLIFSMSCARNGPPLWPQGQQSAGNRPRCWVLCAVWTRCICKKSMSQLAWDLKIAIKAPSSSLIPSFRCSPALLEFETVASNFLGLQRLTQAPWNSVPSVELCWWLNPWGRHSRKRHKILGGDFLTIGTLFLSYVKAIKNPPT